MRVENKMKAGFDVLNTKTNFDGVSIKVTDLELPLFCFSIGFNMQLKRCPIKSLNEHFNLNDLAFVLVLRGAKSVKLLLLALFK